MDHFFTGAKLIFVTDTDCYHYFTPLAGNMMSHEYHIKKLSAIHQPVCGDNLEFTATPPRPLHEHYALYDNAADDLRHLYLGQNMSSFSVLQMCEDDLSAICCDRRFNRIQSQRECRTLSPIYGTLIHSHIASGMRRRLQFNGTIRL